MKNTKTFCITLVIYGLTITFSFVLGLIVSDKRSFSDWFVTAVILMLVLFLIGSYITITARWKIVSLLISKNVKDESPPYRIERYIQRWWKYEDPDEDEFPIFVDMRGRRSQDPEERMRQAIEKWEQVKKQPNGVFLEEFLASEFGVTNGVLNVSKSKFYSRRRQLKKLAEEKQQN